ncbi:MAG: dihydrodipicolinate synthase family protein [Clostridia bacterium]|nr:dihydrodipicolinate synthase family protein [Clostridia bacterium]
MKKEIPGGIYPTMLTPFTEDNKIDYNGVLRLLEFYKNNGCDGIFAVCQSSEMFFLSSEEKLELLKFIMANLPEGMAVVASGHTADDFDTQINEAKALIDTGIDAYVFLSNRFCREDEDDSVFLGNFEKTVNSLPDIPFGIYECPFPYKKIVSPYLIEKCCEIAELSFIKDTCCDINLIRKKLEAAKGTGLKIFNANGATFYESLKAGCAGYSGVMANFHPELYALLYRNYKKDPMKAEALASFLSMASVIELQQYPVNAKYHMTKRGVNISLKTRVRDCSGFKECNKMEIDAMYETEKMIAALFEF